MVSAKYAIVFGFILAFAQMATVSGLTDSCLDCGADCLSAVQSAVPVCIAAGLEISSSLLDCVSGLMAAARGCHKCIKSLVCCVTDSCSICECDCHNLLQFQAPAFSSAFQDHSWLFTEQCHFAYIGNPPCHGCEGKNVYKSVNCSKSVFLHYHDYLIDGRWTVTQDVDSDDFASVIRNKGDGFDDEECPEKETTRWEYRSKKAPDAGWHSGDDLKLVPFIKEGELREKALKLREKSSNFRK